jgi:ferric-dicitrate binding protein FerR (iron transport regulator)
MEDEVRLTVVTGKVAFAQSDDRDEVIVTPGNMASLVSSDMTIATGANNDVNFLSWKTHQLIFDNLPLHELLGVLEKHYTTTIKLEKENLGHCRFTGNFTNTGLEDVLSIITRSVGGNFTENNGVFIIQGEGCN